MQASPPPAALISPPNWTQRLSLADYFPPDKPLDVDLGCGKGRFLLNRAAKHPERSYLGVDRLLVRLQKVEKRIARAALPHVRLLRIEAAYAVTHLLPPASVTAYTIFFPDPWPKRRHHRRRLITPSFLDAVAHTLRPAGQLHFASDHADYCEAVRACFEQRTDYTPIEPDIPTEDERTDFERLFLAQGQTIGRCSYRLAATTASAREQDPAQPETRG